MTESVNKIMGKKKEVIALVAMVSIILGGIITFFLFITDAFNLPYVIVLDNNHEWASFFTSSAQLSGTLAALIIALVSIVYFKRGLSIEKAVSNFLNIDGKITSYQVSGNLEFIFISFSVFIFLAISIDSLYQSALIIGDNVTAKEIEESINRTLDLYFMSFTLLFGSLFIRVSNIIGNELLKKSMKFFKR